MTEQHVPIEDLAAFVAGDLDPAAAVPVEAHVVLCAECRADADAIRSATGALGTLPPAPMPSDVAARLDAALAREAAPLGDVVPMPRRRPSFAGIAAVAAGVALLGALTIPFVTGSGRDGDAGSTAALEDREAAKGTRRIESGLDYGTGQLATTLDRALAGVSAPRAAAGGANPQATTTGDTAPAAPTSVDTAVGGSSGTRYTTRALRTDVGRLAACLDAIVGDVSVAAGRVPLVVDYALFHGREAVVFVFPSIQSDGTVRDNRVDVYVVGGGCGTEPGGNVLEFQRLVRPAL